MRAACDMFAIKRIVKVINGLPFTRLGGAEKAREKNKTGPHPIDDANIQNKTNPSSHTHFLRALPLPSTNTKQNIEFQANRNKFTTRGEIELVKDLLTDIFTLHALVLKENDKHAALPHGLTCFLFLYVFCLHSMCHQLVVRFAGMCFLLHCFSIHLHPNRTK